MIKFKGSSHSGAQAWFAQRITGFVLVILLVGHFLLKHFGLEEPGAGQITYAVVAKQLANPAWKLFEISFLVVALYHALNGIWMIAADYVHPPVLRVGVYTILWLAGIALLIMGIMTLVPFALTT